MRRWVILSVTVFALAVASSASSVFAQTVRFRAPESSAAKLEQLLTQGAELEQDRRWDEALSLYEDAVREYPEQPRVRHLRDLSRMHYDLGRRYADQSFRQSLATMPPRDVARLYDEVLQMLETHYVDAPNWRMLVDRGTTALEVALTDEIFLDEHLPHVSTERINRFRRDIREKLRARVVRDRFDARSAAEYVAERLRTDMQVPPSAGLFEYVCGATNTLDNYSNFLTASQLREVYSQIDGNFVGLGVELKADNDALLIVRVIPGSPAEESGLRAGDRIVAVDGQTTTDLSTDSAADLLQGPEGSFVDVSVVSRTRRQPYQVRVRRAHVEVPSVDDVHIADREAGIGYMRLVSFQKTTNDDIDRALWQLHRQHMQALVLDLRGNPGGLLTAAVEVADKFLEDGIIVSTRGRNPREDFVYRAQRPGTWQMPLVVLIDGDSASASEIFAGAIRDHARGTIVGTTSYGKGSVQGIFPLRVASTGIRLTTAKFYSPKGYPFSGQGVEPNVVVHRVAHSGEAAAVVDANYGDDSRDSAYDAAVSAARRLIPSHHAANRRAS